MRLFYSYPFSTYVIISSVQSLISNSYLYTIYSVHPHRQQQDFGFYLFDEKLEVNIPSVAMPSIIQTAFGLEAVVQIASGLALITSPQSATNFLTSGPSMPSAIMPAITMDLFQLIGIALLALTTPLVMGLPEGPLAVERRRIAYYVLGGAEVLLVPFLSWKALTGSGGVQPARAIQLAGSMVPFLAFRIWAVWVKPEMLAAQVTSKKRE